jgi:hypothetical protein
VCDTLRGSTHVPRPIGEEPSPFNGWGRLREASTSANMYGVWAGFFTLFFSTRHVFRMKLATKRQKMHMTQDELMSTLPPSGFAPPLHRNIRHGPESRRRGSSCA